MLLFQWKDKCLLESILKWTLLKFQSLFQEAYVHSLLEKEKYETSVIVSPYIFLNDSFNSDSSPLPLEVPALQGQGQISDWADFTFWDRGYFKFFRFFYCSFLTYLTFYLKIILTCWDSNLHQFKLAPLTSRPPWSKSQF